MKLLVFTMPAQAPHTADRYVMDLAAAARREPMENRLA